VSLSSQSASHTCVAHAVLARKAQGPSAASLGAQNQHKGQSEPCGPSLERIKGSPTGCTHLSLLISSLSNTSRGKRSPMAPVFGKESCGGSVSTAPAKARNPTPARSALQADLAVALCGLRIASLKWRLNVSQMRPRDLPNAWKNALEEANPQTLSDQQDAAADAKPGRSLGRRLG
jgi:hypothetical protein